MGDNNYDGGDDVFGNIECEEYEPKIKKSIPKVDYTPKMDHNLWFMNNDGIDKNELTRILNEVDPKELKIKENVNRRKLKMMAKSVRHKIDYLYFNGDYLECLQSCEQMNQFHRLLGDKSSQQLVPDLQIRCHYRLGQYQSAIEKIIEYEQLFITPTSLPSNGSGLTQKDTDIIILLAQSLHHLLKFEESITQYQRCIGVSNYIWEWWFNLGLSYLCIPIDTINKKNYQSFIKINSNSNGGSSSTNNFEDIEINDTDHLLQIQVDKVSFHHLYCAKYSFNIASYYISQSVSSKKKLDIKLGYTHPMIYMMLIIQHLNNQINVDYINNSSSSSNQNNSNSNNNTAKQQHIQFNDFEIKYFVEYRDMSQYSQQDETGDEINPYAL